MSEVKPNQLYVLKCEAGKWYIGRSANVAKRFQQHMDGKGAKWTQLHRPITIHEVRNIVGEAESAENDLACEYMQKYGIENVRGGEYSAVEFRSWDIQEIKRKLDTFVAPTVISPTVISQTVIAPTVISPMLCSRCGRNNHTIQKCYASTFVNGTRIPKPKAVVMATPEITLELPNIPYKDIVTPPEEVPSCAEKVEVPSCAEKVEVPSCSQEDPSSPPPDDIPKKIANEFLNPDSDLRSGRWFKKVFGF